MNSLYFLVQMEEVYIHLFMYIYVLFKKSKKYVDNAFISMIWFICKINSVTEKAQTNY